MAPGCMRTATVRSAARFASVLGIVALLLASMGIHPLYLAIFAVAVTLASNVVMILFLTRGAEASDGPGGRPLAAPEGQQLDLKSCAQGYAMVPLTLISIMCLALYKAEADAASARSGREQPAATKLAGTLILGMAGCQGLLDEGSSRDSQRLEATIYLLHKKFIGGTLFASFAYLAVLGVRALLTEYGPHCAPETAWTRAARSAARGLFAVAVGLLVFAVVGFSPILLCGIAFGVSVLGSGVMLSTLAAPEAGALSTGPTMRMQVQAHSFSVITLSCMYCLGCVILERLAEHLGEDQEEIKLRWVGFQLAFAASVWFAVMLAVRAAFKSARWSAEGA